MISYKYIIVKYVDAEEVKNGYAEKLYYNSSVSPIFTCRKELANKYSNKRIAENDRKYAEKYASGSDIKGKVVVEKI